jgi:hypothetical protein
MISSLMAEFGRKNYGAANDDEISPGKAKACLVV